MVLLSCNTAVAILTSQLFSILLLGEIYILKYDLPAMVIIVVGTILTILQSNFEETHYSAEDIKTLLASPAAIGYFIATALILIFTGYLHHL